MINPFRLPGNCDCCEILSFYIGRDDVFIILVKSLFHSIIVHNAKYYNIGFYDTL